MTKPTLDTYGGRLRDAGYAGMVANQSPSTIVDRVNAAATAIEFGYAVARVGTNQVKAPAFDVDLIEGIAVRHAVHPADSSGNVAYARYQAVPVMKVGYIYCLADENASAGDIAVSLTAKSGKLGSAANTPTSTAASAAKAGGNTGDGTLTLDATTPVLAGAKAGIYAVRCITAALNGGTFRVEDPDGNVIGDVAVGATFSDDIKFVIADGAADFVVGDGFDITVTAASGRVALDGTGNKPKVVWEHAVTSGSIGLVRINS